MELIIVLVLGILLFALIGVISTLMWMFKSPTVKTKTTLATAKPSLKTDVEAASRLLDYLRSQKGIDAKRYQELNTFLEDRFTRDGLTNELVFRPLPSASSTQPESQSERAPWPANPNEIAPTSNLDNSSTVENAEDSIQFLPKRVRPTRQAQTPPSTTTNPTQKTEAVEPPVDSSAFKEVPPIRPVVDSQEEPEPIVAQFANQASPFASAISGSSSSSSGPARSTAASKPAPWDIPDPPAKPPSRTFSEMMSGFMQERNMRWGELTSGILIVLSAVGLVLSLREELRNTIPYFSALLFMLITAAIHGAGIYTLKKWKLRNTSRGTLIIGLLLIPLNFVAACILSGGEQRRELTDPWLWMAISIGVAGFTAMSWWSSKLLFRKWNWPIPAAIVGCGIGTLVINRVMGNAESSFDYLTYSLPVLLSFLVGTCLAIPNQWTRPKWSSRSANRMFMFLGVAAFALIASLGLVLIRTEAKAEGFIALTPILSLVFVVTSWIGSTIHRGAVGKTSNAHAVSGLTLKVLGLILLAISLLGSLSNPTVFFANTVVSSIVLLAMFIHQKDEKLFPIAWTVLASGILALANLITGKFAYDSWSTMSQTGEALIDGKSGLSLLGVGAVVVGLNAGIGRLLEIKDRESFKLRGWITGTGIFLAGCLIALVASFVNRDNLFDVMTASGLLSIAGIGLMTASVFASKRLQKWKQYRIEFWASGFLVLAIGHTFLWNTTAKEFIESTTGNIGASWLVMIALASLMFVGAAVSLKRRSTADEPNSAANWYLILGAIATAVLSVGSFALVPHQSGWATGFQAIATLSWLGVGWFGAQTAGLAGGPRTLSQAQAAKDDWRDVIAWPFALSTVVLLCVAIAELASKMDWCPEFMVAKHWLIQACAVSVWTICWTIMSFSFKTTRRMKWVSETSVGFEKLILAGLLLLVGVLIGDAVISGSADELIRESDYVSQFSIQTEMAWTYCALGAMAVATAVSLLVAPSLTMGTILVLVWVFAWCLSATLFGDSKSVASAIRWLLPIAGLVGAGLASTRKKLFPVWANTRNQLALSGSSRWGSNSSRKLIDFALALVAGVVLLISTLTVAQVLIQGGDSLGGPLAGSWFKSMGAELSFGVPVLMIVSTFLIYAVSERRSLLASVGSAVLQYIVLLAVVLLFVSPHPKLASSWFVGILQSVSLAMSGYGFVWYLMRGRIESPESIGNRNSTGTTSWFGGRFSQIEIHTLINGLLVTSLAAMVMGRFYVYPNQTGDWISSVGSLMGIASWALFGGLAYFVWQEKLSQRSVSTWSWLIGWMGLILVGLIAAIVDHYASESLGLPFKIITVGSVLVACAQFGVGWILTNRQNQQTHLSVNTNLSFATPPSPLSIATPSLIVGGLGLVFAIRGAMMSVESFWFYFAVIASLLVLAIGVGCVARSSSMGFVSAAMTALVVSLVFWVDPQSWFAKASQPYWFNMMAIAWGTLGAGWTLFYLVRRKGHLEPIRRRFLWMPNVALLIVSVWIFMASLLQLVCEWGSINATSLSNPLGMIAVGVAVVFSIISIFNDRARFRVVSWCLLSLSVAMLAIAKFVPEEEGFVAIVLTLATCVAAWGMTWLNRSVLASAAKSAGATRMMALERKAATQLPIYSLLIAGVVLAGTFVVLMNGFPRLHRYIVSGTPLMLAIGFGCQSNQSARRWLQLLTLGLVTLGSLLVAWADIPSLELFGSENGLRILVRSMLVLAGAMFVYGGLVTRWVRPGDTWIKSLRETAFVTCIMAVACFALLIANEIATFQPGVGCGLLVSEAIMVALLVAAMIFGLIVIAVRPENDPFALSLTGRMTYVYAAECVTVALLGHVYLSMPWLFESGIAQYWPFIVMAVCFAGVGLAQLLESRKLTVLGKPIFNTVAVLPLLVAAALFLVESKADSAIVLLTVGMIYLLISFLNRSISCGFAAVVFGNLALWVFFQRTDAFAFLDHPQLWLIPPAVSTLVAAHFSRSILSQKQIGAIRYMCVAVIYLSSTIEIFIAGIGDNLWPPALLALFSVMGILFGMMMRIRSFLYFGSLFLLMAMITMVAHAQQRLDHVWPWWAFGVALGIGILVMFGLFEKRKKEMNAIANRLKDWEV